MIQGKKLAQPNTVLNEREEKRFEEFYVRFSRTGQSLTFSELLMFALDRSIIHNKIGFSTLHAYFDDACSQQFASDKAKEDNRPIYPGMIVDRGVTRQQFNFLLAQLSFHIYHSDKHHLDRLLSEILAEKTVVNKDSTMEIVRNLIYDEINKRILSESVIKVICSYETEVKNLFTIYLQENMDLQDIMLSWKEIAIQNKKMNAQALIRFLREADIVPHILSIEQFEEVMMKVVPPANNREHEFYSKGVIVHLYEKEDNLLRRVDGDPHLYFHEFQLLLARIAFETCSKDDIKDVKKDPERITRFFGQILFLRQNDEVMYKALPNLNRRMIYNLERYTSFLMSPYQEDEDYLHTDKHEDTQVDPIQAIAQQQQELLFDAQILELNFSIEQVYKQLDKELPPVPPKPEHQKVQDSWQPESRKVIGDPLPAPPPDKNKKSSKPKQQQRRKPGEPEPRKIIFEDPNKPPHKTSEQYQMELVDKLNFEQKLLSNVERGTMSDIQVIPVLITEILYPPNPPKQVRILVEAAINSHNEGNFIQALNNYEQARKEWISIEGKDLSDGLELFFEFQRGSVYESAGRDDLALSTYLQARIYGNKLPLNSPDRALAYAGLGLIFYNTEEWELALRSFLKAREYREKLLGIETVDTATIFNNLGCCMYVLERNQEAYAYFKLSHAVLEQQLGPYHTRTLTAARNLMKCNKNYFDNIPEYKKLWVTYVQDPFAGAGGKKKKKKKGKK